MTSDLDLWVKVTLNVAQYPLHHVTYVAATVKEMLLHENDFLDLVSHRMLPSTLYIM